MTTKVPIVREKRKNSEKSARRHKKRKGKKKVGTVRITNNYYTLLRKTMIELTNQSLQKIDER